MYRPSDGMNLVEHLYADPVTSCSLSYSASYRHSGALSSESENANMLMFSRHYIIFTMFTSLLITKHKVQLRVIAMALV